MYILHIYIYNIYTKIQTHRKEENYHLLNIHSVVMLCSNLPYTIHRTVTTVSIQLTEGWEAGPEHLASSVSAAVPCSAAQCWKLKLHLELTPPNLTE